MPCLYETYVLLGLSCSLRVSPVGLGAGGAAYSVGALETALRMSMRSSRRLFGMAVLPSNSENSIPKPWSMSGEIYILIRTYSKRDKLEEVVTVCDHLCFLFLGQTEHEAEGKRSRFRLIAWLKALVVAPKSSARSVSSITFWSRIKSIEPLIRSTGTGIGCLAVCSVSFFIVPRHL